jgi:hypothetical protein
MRKRASVRYVNIAGISVAMENCDKLMMSLNTVYKSFRVLLRDQGQPDMTIRYVEEVSALSLPGQAFDIDPLSFCDSSEGILYYPSDPALVPNTFVTADRAWTDITIKSNTKKIKPNWLDLFTDIAFRTRLSDFGGFCLHRNE